jgi:hypothetical protein
MRITGRPILVKLQRKNIGNTKLCREINKLLIDLQRFNPSVDRLDQLRPDADQVHNEGFYFFNIEIHRTLVLIEFDNEGEATIIWAGTHQQYERTFRNNKSTIDKWLKNRGYI